MKKNLLKVLALVLALATVFSFVACGAKKEDAPVDEKKEETKTDDKKEETKTDEPAIVSGDDIGTGETYEGLKIGYTVGSEPEFQTKVRVGLQAACDEKGYELQIGVHGGDTTKQRSFVEAFCNAGCQVCMDFASNAETGAALTDICTDAGVYMIGIDGDYGEPAFYFGTNNPLCATNNGTILGEWVRDNWDGKVDKYVRFTNPEWSPLLQSRTEGGWDAFVTVLPDYADKKDDMYCEVYDNSDVLVSQQNVRDWFTQQDDAVTSAWISLSDNSIQTAVTEIQSMGKEKQTVCVSNDCTQVFLEQLVTLGENTCWVSSLNFNPGNYGGLLVKLAEDIMKDASAVPHMSSFDLPGCNISNVEEMFPEKYAEIKANLEG